MEKVFQFKGVSYPVNTEPAEFLPDVTNFLDGSLDEDNLKGMVASIKMNRPLLLVGPTGSGKTATVRWLARETNNSYRRIQLNGSTTVDDFVGRTLLDPNGTYWVDGILTDAMRKGHWLLLDEINAALPEILFVLNSILDDDRCLILADKEDREVLKPHPNFRLFAAMNPWQDYAGTKELNRAQMDRFMVVEYTYPENIFEQRIVAKHSGILLSLGKDGTKGRPVIERMVEFANIIRKKNKDGELTAICSTRQLIQWVQLGEYLDIKHAAKLSIINKCDDDEKEKVSDELNKLFRNGESIAKHKKNRIAFLKAEQKKNNAPPPNMNDKPTAVSKVVNDPPVKTYTSSYGPRVNDLISGMDSNIIIDDPMPVDADFIKATKIAQGKITSTVTIN